MLRSYRAYRQNRKQRALSKVNCDLEAAEPLEAAYDASQLLADLLGRLLEPRIVDRHHRGDGIDRRHLDLAVGRFLHDDVARQHGADLVLELERLVSELGIAGAQDAIPAEIGADLVLQGVLDVDLGEDAEAFLLEARLRSGAPPRRNPRRASC